MGALERGARLPQLDTVLKLAFALSVPPGELIEGMAWVFGEFALSHPLGDAD